ncbi:MAG: 4-demethylwyosine synthase TYW1 [Candidatus Woesearchaeota archaeon]
MPADIIEKKRERFEIQGYRIVGNHSAIKICHWCKQWLKNKGVCYKNDFYGIQSHRCVQMTPSLQHCSLRCQWCWRDTATATSKWSGPIDEPKDIVDGCIHEQKKILMGFGGNDDINKKTFQEALKPLHFAISLTGEPTLYPRLGELISEIHSRGMTTFLVTNATQPDALKKLVGKSEPTQLYYTIPAPDERTFIKSCNPSDKGAWKNILQSLELMNSFSCRKTIRLTLAKEYNMINAEGYAELIRIANPDFVETKSYMWLGYSRKRLKKENSPSNKELGDFTKAIAKALGWKLIAEKKESKVFLIMKDDKKERVMRF